jgi:nucleoside-diphosphate-sugar epimerase
VRRVLITGGAGFVGANLLRRLLTDGYDVHALLRPNQNTWRIDDILSDLATYRVDITDPNRLSDVLRNARPDWVFHLAAHGAYPEQTRWQEMVGTNIIGLMQLVDAAMKVGFETFINAGSSSEYGPKAHAPSESEWLDPNSTYAVTKATATLYCRHVALSNQLRLTTLRLYSAFGPFEAPTRLVPRLLIKAMDGELPLLTQPSTARDFVYVGDVADAFIHTAMAPNLSIGSVYNVGTGVQTSIKQIVSLVRELLSVSIEPRWGSMADRVWDTDVWVADPGLIRHELGWIPTTSLREGLIQTIEWLALHDDIRRRYQVV